MADIESLRRDINEITNRAKSTIVFDKQKEFKEGIKEIESTYGATYTTDALNEKLGEYKRNKLDEITNQLNQFDDKSQKLVDKTDSRIGGIESELSTAMDPNTQYELEKHNYILNKLQNELSSTFTGQRPTTNELDEVLNQAKYNKLYANALLQTKNLLIQNIDNNSNVKETSKAILKSHVQGELNEIKNKVLPKEYHEFRELKKQLHHSKVASKDKTTMFKFMLGMNNEAKTKQ